MPRAWGLLLTLGALLLAQSSFAVTVDFEDVTYADGYSYESGEHLSGSFQSHGVTFINEEKFPFYWEGFYFSKTTDTTTSSFLNQYSAFPGTGAGGSTSYGVSHGYLNLQPTADGVTQTFAFNPSNPAHLNLLPRFVLPANSSIGSVSITNTTYAALSMRDGDGFSGPKYGGDDGELPDWFKVTAYGTDANGVPLANTVELYLADFQAAGTANDYIIDEWVTWDLSALAGASTIYFNPTSSRVGEYGMNTPGYFAIDNIQISAIPEPATYAGLLLLASGVFYWQRRRVLIA